MTGSRFRSIAALTRAHRRTVPAIDRATFVIFSLDARRFAAPVEMVERVLRPAGSPRDGEARAADEDEGSPRVVSHAGQAVPLVDLRAALGVASNTVGAPMTRVLVFALDAVWVAAEVDAVHEVVGVDVLTVRGLPLDVPSAWRTPGSEVVWPRGAQGMFSRHDHEVLVLDMAQLLRSPHAAAQADTDTAESPV